MTDEAPADEVPATDPTLAPSSPRARGWFTLYVAAFVLVLAAAAFVVVSATDFFRSMTPLYVSIGLSAGAIVLAIAAVVLPKRGG